MLATLRQRNFALVWFGGLISLIGDRAMLTALPFFVYQQTGSTLGMSALFTAYYLPMVLFSSIAGVFVDRWNRRNVMIWTNLLQATALLPLLLVQSERLVWLLYLVAFIESSAAIFFGPAESAIVPNLVTADQLVPANALGNLNNTIARLLGPPLGGVLLGLFGLISVVIIDTASFLIAAAMFSRINVPFNVPSTAHLAQRNEHERSTSVFALWGQLGREWRDGLRVIRRDRLLVAIFVVNSVTSFGGSMIDPLYAPFVGVVLQGGPAALGLLSTTSALGGLIAGLIVGKWGSRIEPRKLTAYGTLAVGLLMVTMYNQNTLSGVMILSFVMFVPLVASSVGVQTMLQTSVSDRYRGRVFGALGTTIAAIGLASLWLSGIGSTLLGIVPMLSIAGGVTVVAGVLGLVLFPRTFQLTTAADDTGSSPSNHT